MRVLPYNSQNVSEKMLVMHQEKLLLVKGDDDAFQLLWALHRSFIL